MEKVNVIILICALLGLTLLICVNRPEMHKQIMVTDSDFEFVVENDFTPLAQKSVVEVKATEKPATAPAVQTVQPPKTTKQPKVQQQKPVQKQVTQPPTAKEVQKTVQKPTQQNATKPVQQKPAAKETQKTVKTTPKPSQTTASATLTEREEIIAWNKWRSNFQNQVMKDANISAPLGTGFKFSFTVDKFGNMSNIKVWSTTPVYTEMAVRALKPLLLSYEGKSILNFPKGTKRVITNVTGGFVMATSTGYSTPGDYSDYERVKR